MEKRLTLNSGGGEGLDVYYSHGQVWFSTTTGDTSARLNLKEVARLRDWLSGVLMLEEYK
jgi:hypothetical protein